jgi:hypothetical protein
VNASFRAVSLLIDTRGQDWEIDRDVLWTPGLSGTRQARMIVHEAIHYWQQLSQGFVVRLAQEQWDRLVEFETSGCDSGPGSLAEEFDRRVPGVDLSARDLHEGLARFWDVMAFGPSQVLDLEWSKPDRLANPDLVELYEEMRREAATPAGTVSGVDFIWAMSIGAGRYAKPFNSFVERLQDPFPAACLFPLLGHFAMQTSRPAEMYAKFLETAAPRLLELGREESVFTSPYPVFDAAVNSLYVRARTECDLIARAEGDRLTMGMEAFESGTLRVHPLYRWAFGERVLPTCLSLARTREAAAMANELFGGQRGAHLAGKLLLDGALATAGLSDSRMLLLCGGVLAPPCFRLETGELVLPSRQWREAWVRPPEDVENPNLLIALVPLVERPGLDDEEEMIARSCIKIETRWQALQQQGSPPSRTGPRRRWSPCESDPGE